LAEKTGFSATHQPERVQAGASSSAIVYSVIETAKENKLKPFDYLKFVFEKIQHGEIEIEKMLPWSEDLPENLFVKE